MSTRSEIRCEKPAFLVLFRLKYCILCLLSVEIIVFELKEPFTIQKSNKTKYYFIQTIAGAE